MNTEEFRSRIAKQLEVERLAYDKYSELAALTKPGEYRDMFLVISGQEENHVRLCEEILALLQ